MLDVHKLDILIKAKGYTNIALSKMLEGYGIKKTEATIRKYRYGTNDPDTKTLSVLADILGVTEQDLFVGAKKRREQIVREEIKNLNIDVVSCKLLNEEIYAAIDKTLIAEDVQDKLVIVRITGDSMAPYLHPGDFAICKLDDKLPKEDGKYLLYTGSKYFIKNVKFFSDNSIRLISENKLYRSEKEFDEEVTLKQKSNLQIVGKIVARFVQN